MRSSRIQLIAVLCAAAVIAGGIGVFMLRADTDHKRSQMVAFTEEVVRKIHQQYWKDIETNRLTTLYTRAANRVSSTTKSSVPSNAGIPDIVNAALSHTPPEQWSQTVATMNAAVLRSLPPRGRSGLMTHTQEKQFRDTVANVHPNRDLYERLGLERGASLSKTTQVAAEQQKQLRRKQTTIEQQLAAATSSSAKRQLSQAKQELQQKQQKIEKAARVLTDKNNKQRYDTYGAEPTVFTRMSSPDILTLRIEQFAPTTFDELQDAVAAMKRHRPETVILDLRGNIGGALANAPRVIGMIRGTGTPAYRLKRKGEIETTRARTAQASLFKKVEQLLVLIDSETKSTAEVVANALSRSSRASLVGTTTKGWGSIENTYPIMTSIAARTRHTALLVNHLTLRTDGAPIEQNGVQPDIRTGRADWRARLRDRIDERSVRETVSSLLRRQQ